MSWLPSPAEVAGHPGRAFAGGLVAFALVLFLVHGFPSGTGLDTPVGIYAVAKFSPSSLIPRRQVALYVALATPAGTALLRAVEGQTLAQTKLTYDAARGRRSPDWKALAPAVRYRAGGHRINYNIAHGEAPAAGRGVRAEARRGARHGRRTVGW